MVDSKKHSFMKNNAILTKEDQFEGELNK